MILNEKQLKSISKFLSFILRHHPEQISTTLDKNGWVDIDALLTQINHPEHGFMGNPLAYETLLEMVGSNGKKRFTLSENGKRIHVAQGYSMIQIQVEHKVATPPQILYHGMVERPVPSILEQDLHSTSRHFVHSSADIATTVNIGSRYDKPVISTINTVVMLTIGHQLYPTDNGI